LRRGHANILCIVPMLTDDPPKGIQPCFVRLVTEGSFFCQTTVAHTALVTIVALEVAESEHTGNTTRDSEARHKLHITSTARNCLGICGEVKTRKCLCSGPSRPCFVAGRNYSQIASHKGALSECILNLSWAIMGHHGLFLIACSRKPSGG